MKIRCSITRIPSIFQTSTHVWGKPINYLLVLGLKLSKRYFWSIQEADPGFFPLLARDIAAVVLGWTFVSRPSFPLPCQFSCENASSFSKTYSFVLLMNRGHQPHMQSDVLGSLLGEETQWWVFEVLAARAPASGGLWSFRPQHKDSLSKPFPSLFSLFSF